MDPDLVAELERVRMDPTTAGVELLARLDPTYFAAFKGLYADAVLGRKDGLLGRKQQELILMACNAVLRSNDGLRRHMRKALGQGASGREVIETLEVAAVAGGYPVMWRGVEFLAEALPGEAPAGPPEARGG